MTINGSRILFWTVVALIGWMVYKVPTTMSSIVSGIGHAFTSMANGFAHFLHGVAPRSL
jgi:hypothetical protein